MIFKYVCFGLDAKEILWAVFQVSSNNWHELGETNSVLIVTFDNAVSFGDPYRTRQYDLGKRQCNISVSKGWRETPD